MDRFLFDRDLRHERVKFKFLQNFYKLLSIDSINSIKPAFLRIIFYKQFYINPFLFGIWKSWHRHWHGIGICIGIAIILKRLFPTDVSENSKNFKSSYSKNFWKLPSKIFMLESYTWQPFWEFSKKLLRVTILQRICQHLLL